MDPNQPDLPNLKIPADPYGDWTVNEPPPATVSDFMDRVWGCDPSRLNAADQGRLAAICGGKLPRKRSESPKSFDDLMGSPDPDWQQRSIAK